MCLGIVCKVNKQDFANTKININHENKHRIKTQAQVNKTKFTLN